MSPKRKDIGLTVMRSGAEEPNLPERRRIEVERPILARNQELAAGNRERFARLGLTVLNVVSSPGSGKTELLARSLALLPGASAVIVGDLETDNDATRLNRAGIETVQITTGGVCHLEADMVAKAADQLDLERFDLIVIENVGNLVCPAAFDLGEDLRLVLLSVTEGEDKPLKYPKIFKTADAVVLTKIDIAEAVGFDRAAAMANIHAVTPDAVVFELSARSGVGMRAFVDWLTAQTTRARLAAVSTAESTATHSAESSALRNRT